MLYLQSARLVISVRGLAIRGSVSNSNTSIFSTIFYPKITTTVILYNVPNAKSNNLQYAVI